MKDKDLIRSRFDRAMDTYQANACVQDKMAARLIDLLDDVSVRQHYHKVLEIGCGTGLLTRRIQECLGPEMLWLNDLCPSAERFICAGHGVEFLAGDAENVDFPMGLDLIISSATIQWFDSLKAFFSKCADSLDDGGILAFSTFGRKNIREITEIEGVGLEYYGIDELKEFLDGRFEVLAAEEGEERLCFNTPMEVLRHLRETGVTGLGRGKWTRGRLMSFAHRYAELFSDGHRVPLTYHPIWIVAKKRHCGHALP